VKIARRYLISRGYQTIEPVDHEGAITCPLPVANIRKVILFPSPEFIVLTGCDGWKRSDEKSAIPRGFINLLAARRALQPVVSR
jgi:hypothetical protein